MQVTVERLSPEEVHLHVDVEKERLDKYLDQAYRTLVRRYQIPGFRVGKAPRPIFERFVGRETLLREAIDRLVPEAYEEALKESGIVPYERGTIEAVESGEDGLHFRARVYLKPEVRLPDVRALQVELPEETVTEELVAETIEQLREQKATLVPEEVADENSVVRVEGAFLDESGQTFRDVDIHLKDAYDEIRAGLNGCRAGEEREITYKDGDVERRARFKVVSVHRMELPELDDDFARLFGEESLESMRAVVREQLERTLAERRKVARANRILSELIAKAEVAEPRFLIEREKEVLRRLTRPGEAPSEEALEQEARQRVRSQLVVNQLLEERGIQITSEELGRAAAQVAFEMGRRKVTDADVSEAYQWVLSQKLVELLTELVPEERGASPENAGTAKAEDAPSEGGEGPPAAQD